MRADIHRRTSWPPQKNKLKCSAKLVQRWFRRGSGVVQSGSEVVQRWFRAVQGWFKGVPGWFKGVPGVIQRGARVVHRGASGNSEVCQALQEPSRKLPWTHYATGWLVWQSAAAYVSGMLALDSPTHRTWYDDGQPSQHTSVPPPPHMQHTSSFASSCRRAKSEHAHCDAPGLA